MRVETGAVRTYQAYKNALQQLETEVENYKLSMQLLDLVLKRFELGANATLGYQFKNGLLLSANYMRGLTNITDFGSDNARSNTRYAGLSIGYVFGK